MSRKKNLIAYCSPNGGTRLAAETIGGTLEKYNHQVTYLDLGTGENRSRTGQVNIDEYSCLWVGSPIYSNHALPPVMTFISGLEPGKATSAAVFVTYGLATSGLGMMGNGPGPDGQRLSPAGGGQGSRGSFHAVAGLINLWARGVRTKAT